jgi:C-terminal processing protease CtpA/Prc
MPRIEDEHLTASIVQRTQRRRTIGRVLVACALMLTLGVATAAEERGTFGVKFTIDGEGFFLNPILKSVTVESVAPSSPAFGAGIAKGDQVIEADGHPVVGARARDLQPIVSKRIGESIRLRLRRANGEEYEASMVAVRRPDGG